jgi:beta-glucosidase-like glycosyl hydrolase
MEVCAIRSEIINKEIILLTLHFLKEIDKKELNKVHNSLTKFIIIPQEHRDLAREAVRKSLVLLKNGKSSYDKPVLPLSKKAPRILIAGTHADNLGYQCGGWTIEWQGLSGRITSGSTTPFLLFLRNNSYTVVSFLRSF